MQKLSGPAAERNRIEVGIRVRRVVAGLNTTWRWIIRRDSRQPNLKSNLRPAGRFSPIDLKILVDEENVIDPLSSEQTQGIILLDEAAISAEIRRLSETDPYFAKRQVMAFVERVSIRVAHRMARAFSMDWGAPKDMIAEAIYFHVWTELFNLIPLRRLARSIAAKAKHKPMFVVLPKIELECLSLFKQTSELGPLMLCWALQELGCNVYLLSKDRVSERYPAITLHASSHIAPRGDGVNASVLPKERPIVAPEAMRGIDVLFDEVGDASILAGTLILQPLPRSTTFFLLGHEASEPHISVELQKEAQSDFAHLTQYSLRWPQDPLKFYIGHLLGPLFRSMAARAYSLVHDGAIKKAYVCDHLLLVSSIMAHAVKQCGGSVILWPHSSNPSNVDQRQPKYFDEVVVLTNSAKKAWERKFPDKPVQIRPRIMFPPQRKARDFDPSAPLTLVVVGTGSKTARLPVLRMESHIQTYRRFFSFVELASSFVRLKFKPRPGHEDEAWLRGNVVGSQAVVDIETNPITSLNYPNMILIIINHSSTALLEGIACAIPCMIVREQEFEDYVAVNTKVMPTGNADFIWTRITECRSEIVYNNLLQRQIDWLCQELSDR